MSVPTCWAEGYGIRGGSSCVKSGVRIGFAIQKRVAAQLVARLPAIALIVIFHLC
ncbi:hypothetical protein R6Q59_030423 [Mikania micrantha]